MLQVCTSMREPSWQMQSVGVSAPGGAEELAGHARCVSPKQKRYVWENALTCGSHAEYGGVSVKGGSHAEYGGALHFTQTSNYSIVHVFFTLSTVTTRGNLKHSFFGIAQPKSKVSRHPSQ